MSIDSQRLGKYELQQLLGRGSVGEVWKGYDLQHSSAVAVKIFHADVQSDPAFMAQLSMEAPSLKALQHANIVQVREVAISQSTTTTAYIVMDYVERQTLSNYLHATSHQGTFPLASDIVSLFARLGAAVEYAHQRGIVHGNITPDNIFLDTHNISHFAAGEPMLTDFGLRNNRTRPRSAPYMSPEQAKGDVANKQSDIYSLGIILYELCTGIQPFRDGNAEAVMRQHITMLPTPPILINPTMPPALSEVILRAIAKDTMTRFSRASLLVAAITDACSTQPETSVLQPRTDEARVAAIAIGAHPSLPGIGQPFSRLSLPVHARSVLSLPTSGDYTDHSQQMAASQVTPPLPQPLLPRLSLPLSSPLPTVSNATAPTMPITTVVPEMPVQKPITPLRRRKPLYLVIGLPLLLFLIIGSAIGASLLLTPKGQASVGHVFFQDDALGHDDVLYIQIQNIVPPSTGKTYIAWLQSSTHAIFPLGPLAVSNNTVSFLYHGNDQHTNLLSIIQGCIVTLENAENIPTAPHGPIIYSTSMDATLLHYLKNILYETPNLPAHTSVVAGLLDTIRSMNDKAGSIADTLQGSSHDYRLAMRQATRIIELIDGTQYAESNGDLNPQAPTYLHTKIGLISSPTQPGYLDTLATQLDQLQQHIESNTTLLQHIQKVQSAISTLRALVQTMHKYDVQLLKAGNLSTPTMLSVAFQLKQAAADSYTGRASNDDSPQSTLGAYQGYVEAQNMATFDLH